MSALATSRRAIISHAVALILGLIGGFIGHDLSGLQKPVEAVVNTAVDAVEKGTKPAAVADAGTTPADAGVPAAPPAPGADAGAPAPTDAGK